MEGDKFCPEYGKRVKTSSDFYECGATDCRFNKSNKCALLAGEETRKDITMLIESVKKAIQQLP